MQAPADVAVIPVQATDSTLKYVYLTFDDGPEAGTLNSFRVCMEKKVKATYFIVGEHAGRANGKAILDTMRAEGMDIVFANHSYSHAGHNHYESFYHSPDKALADFVRIQDSLHFVEPIIRFPGNNSWVVSSRMRTTRSTRGLAKLMDSVGYNVMGWDLEWRFNHKNKPVQTAEEMARQVENAFRSNNSMVKNHVVLLTHDRMFSEPANRDSLSKMITLLQGEKGYVFRSANEYPTLKKIDRRIIAMRK